MKISKTISVIVRGLELLWAILILALVGHMISTSGWNQIPRKGGNASIVNYCMFVGVLTLLSLTYFIPIIFISIHEEYQVLATIGLDALNVLFYMCGAIAMAALMGVHSCSNEAYTKSNGVTNSSPDTATRCREAQAVTAFLWIGFLTFVASTACSFMNYLHHLNADGVFRRQPTPDHERGGGQPMTDDLPASYKTRHTEGNAMAYKGNYDDSLHTEPVEESPQPLPEMPAMTYNVRD